MPEVADNDLDRNHHGLNRMRDVEGQCLFPKEFKRMTVNMKKLHSTIIPTTTFQ